MLITTRVEPVNQAASLSVALPSLGLSLTLRSDCQSRPIDRRWTIPGLPPGHQISVEIAGQVLVATADATGTATAVWNGRDGAGIPLETAIALLRTGDESRPMRLGRLEARRFGFGGFHLSSYDRLDVVGRRVRTGWGRLIGGVALTPERGGYRLQRDAGRGSAYFDADGFLEHVTNGRGDIVARWLRDSHGLVRHTSHGRDIAVHRSNGAVTIETRGRRVVIDCDEAGRVRSLRDGAGNIMHVAWDPAGMLASVTEPAGFSHRYEYDDDGRLITVHRPGCGPTRLQRMPVDHGHRITLLTAELRETSYTFAKLPDGTRIRTETCCGQRPQTTRIIGSRIEVERGDGARIFSDRAIGERVIVLPSGLTNTRVTRADGILVNGRRWHRSATPTESATITPEGRVTRADYGDGIIGITTRTGSSSIKWNHATGAVTRRSEAGAVTWHSNEIGLLSRVVYADDRHVSFDYDDTGWLTAQHMPGGRVLRLRRAADGAIRTLTPPGKGTTEFEYDAPARVATTRFPAPPTGLDDSVFVEYDRDGLPVARRSGTGERLEMRRDSDGLIYQVNDAADNDHPLVRAAYQGGKPVRIEAGGEVTEFAWDGSLLTATTASGSAAGTVRRTYDSDFLLTGLSCGALAAPLTRDRDGLVTGLGPAILTRDAAGDVTAITAGHVAQRWERDDHRRVTAMTLEIAGRVVWQVCYWYESFEGRRRISALTDSQLPSPQEIPFGYDTAGRLVSAGGPWPLRVNWDDNHNALTLWRERWTGASDDAADDAQHGVPGDAIDHATYDDADRLVAISGCAVAHDGASRVTGRTAAGVEEQFAYNAFDQLVRVTSGRESGVGREVRLKRDGLSKIVAIEIDGQVRHRFVPGPDGYPDAEVDAAGQERALYLGYDSQLPPVLMIQPSRVLFLAMDHLGSLRFAIDIGTGEVVEQRAYDHSGVLRWRDGEAAVPFGWGGGLTDGASDLTHFPARSYDPHLMRFLTRDPLLFRTGATNLYSFVGGDLINRRDPTGLQQVELCRQATPVGQGVVDNPEHWWIKQGGVETGVGGDPAWTTLDSVIAKLTGMPPSRVRDHGQRSKQDGVTCDPVENVDEKCVANAISTDIMGWGEALGTYNPLTNTCQHWVDDVLNACSGGNYVISTNDPDAYNHWYTPTGSVIGDSGRTRPGASADSTPPPSDTSSTDDSGSGGWNPYGDNAIGPNGELWGE